MNDVDLPWQRRGTKNFGWKDRLTLRLFDGLQLFAGFEADSLAGRNAHFRAGTGVAPDSGLAGSYVENAKATQFDAVALRQSLFHTFKDSFNCHFGFGLSDTGLVHDFVDDVEFDHDRLRTQLLTLDN